MDWRAEEARPVTFARSARRGGIWTVNNTNSTVSRLAGASLAT